jgi:hypothetical protein
MKKSKHTVVCKHCNVEFDDEYDVDRICSNAAEASGCSHHPSKRAKFKLRAVDENFKRIEDDPDMLRAAHALIDSGASWHPDIDQDGSIGREANSLIERKICRPPRTEYAKKMRHMFEAAQRFRIDRKGARP